MTSTESPGVIEPGRLYTAEEVKQRLRLGPKAWRELKRDGLRVVGRGRQCYVLGDDVIRLFGSKPPQHAENEAPVV